MSIHRYIKAKTLPKLITKDRLISYTGGSKAAFDAMIEDALGISGDPKK